MSAWDPLTDDEMAELIEYPMLVHLHDAHRLVAALATIATLRDALDRHHAFLLNGVQECGLCKRAALAAAKEAGAGGDGVDGRR